MAENRRSDRKNEIGVGGVVFFKRMIALTLAIIVLALAFPAVHYARAYRRARRDPLDAYTRTPPTTPTRPPRCSTAASAPSTQVCLTPRIWRSNPWI